MISAFGEILGSADWTDGARSPLSSTHYGLQRRCGAEEGKHSAVQQSWPAQYVWVNEGPPCGGAAAEVPDQGEKGMGDSVGQSPPQTPIWFIPPTPRGDNRPGDGVPARPSVPRIRALTPLQRSRISMGQKPAETAYRASDYTIRIMLSVSLSVVRRSYLRISRARWRTCQL